MQNILRDPFETTVGADAKSLLGYGGALAAPSTAYLYNWNMLPIGQVLWLKELESYVEFPPMQDPASYNLTQVMEQVKKMGTPQPEPVTSRYRAGGSRGPPAQSFWTGR